MPRYKVYEYVAWIFLFLSVLDTSWSHYRIIVVSMATIILLASWLEYAVYLRDISRGVFDYLDARYDLKVTLEKKKEKSH